MNPLQIASLMSGDFISVLPAPIQSIARTVLGQQQQSGVAGFLSKATNIFGGNNGGLLGGMGNLFGQAGQQGQNGLGNLLGTFGNAFGGNTGGFGLPSLPNLSGLTNFGAVAPQTQNPGAFQGIINTIGGLAQ